MNLNVFGSALVLLLLCGSGICSKPLNTTTTDSQSNHTDGEQYIQQHFHMEEWTGKNSPNFCDLSERFKKWYYHSTEYGSNAVLELPL